MESERSLEDVRNLFILVAMLRYLRTFAQYDPRQHGPFAISHLPIDQRVEPLRRRVVKSNVLQSRYVLLSVHAHDSSILPSTSRLFCISSVVATQPKL